jgi:ribosomal protein S18 acetylase RimI-like enzyme
MNLFLLCLLLRLAPADDSEALNQRLLTIYGEQLLEAGYDPIQAAYAVECENLETDIQYYYLESDDHRCGFIGYSIQEESAFLQIIYLDPEYRGKGLGADSLSQLEEKIKARGLKGVRLYVFDYNKPAIQLYTKAGYTIETTYDQEGRVIGHHMIKFFQ